MDWQTVFLVIGGGMAALLIAWLAWLTAYILAAREALADDITAIKDDLAAYKLEVANKFASVDHLKEVEKRLIDAMENLGNKLDKFAAAFQEHLVAVASGPRGRSGRKKAGG